MKFALTVPKRTPQQAGYVAIYGLQDPRDDEIRYIGKTVDPKQRHGQHLLTTVNRVRSWIDDMALTGHVPIMIILDVVDSNCSNDSERSWIMQFDDGNLLNSSEGGEGAPSLPRTIQDIEESMSTCCYVRDGRKQPSVQYVSRNASVVSQLNLIRSGKSFKDPGVAGPLKEMCEALSDEQKSCVLSFLDRVAQLVALS